VKSWGSPAIRAVNPDLMNLDPVSAFQGNPDPDTDRIRIQGFNDQKLKIKIKQKSFYILFWLKIAMYSYRRSLQPSKENTQHFKK
jgi:hypothetical protein